jgi:hypothetical protein
MEEEEEEEQDVEEVNRATDVREALGEKDTRPPLKWPEERGGRSHPYGRGAPLRAKLPEII